MNESERLRAGVFPLMNWFHENARSLPWRSEPTPYRVWVSEIMLQQTRVAAVIDYFNRFMEALPGIQDLAACPEEQLLKLWQGLGYYSRAKNLKKAARLLCDQYGGDIPADYTVIRSLPGVGDYTAGAVASIAFGMPVPAVDGNVLRVVTRVVGDSSDITVAATKRKIGALLSEVIPTDGPGQFNQAMMELGALVCVPNGSPDCEKCPVENLCVARAKGLIDQLPVKPPKKARRIEKRQVYLVFNHGRIALRRRPDKGLLASLWEYPNEMEDRLLLDRWGIIPESIESAGIGKHIFTHIEWQMQAASVVTGTEELPPGWVWANARELEEAYPIPNAFSAFEDAVYRGLSETEHDVE